MALTMPINQNEVPDPEYKNVKYSIVWMKAVKALQAQTRIDTLETQLTDALALLIHGLKVHKYK